MKILSPESINIFRKEIRSHYKLNIIKMILLVTANNYEITPESILSNLRLKHIVKARKVAMYLMKELTDLSGEELSLVFNRHRTTIVKNNISTSKDKNLLKSIAYIKKNYEENLQRSKKDVSY